MDNIFDKVITRYGSNCAKWDNAEKVFGEKVLPLTVADMDFQPPQPVLDVLRDIVDHGIFGYAIVEEQYYSTIKNWMKINHDWEIKKDWIVFCPRIIQAVSTIIQNFTEIGDKIAIQTPVYAPLRNAIEKNGRELVECPLVYQDGRYEMDIKDLEEKLDDSVKIFLLCSPHNPVTRVWNKGELQAVGELCVKHDIMIISDEIHADLIYDSVEYTPIGAISQDILYQSIVCTAPTKTFNIPGIQASNIIIARDEWREKFVQLLDVTGLLDTNSFAVPALIAAYNEGKQWLNNVMKYIQNNYKFLDTYIKEYMPELKVIKPEGTYLVWIDCTGLGMKEEEIENWFIHEAKVGVNMGTVFGENGKGFVRMNLGCPRKILEEALNLLANTYPNK